LTDIRQGDGEEHNGAVSRNVCFVLEELFCRRYSRRCWYRGEL